MTYPEPDPNPRTSAEEEFIDRKLLQLDRSPSCDIIYEIRDILGEDDLACYLREQFGNEIIEYYRKLYREE